MIVGIDDIGIRAVHTCECNTLGVSSKFDGTFAGNSVSWVENCASGDGTEHGDVFKTHLTGTILTNAHTAMRTNEIDIGLRNCTHTNLNHKKEKKNNKYL